MNPVLVFFKQISKRIVTSIAFSLWKRKNKGFIGNSLFLVFEKILLSALHLRCFECFTYDEYFSLGYSSLTHVVKSNRKGLFKEPSLSIEESELPPSQTYLPDVRLFSYRDICIYGNSDVILDLRRECIINDLCADKSGRIRYNDKRLISSKNTMALFKGPVKAVKHFQRGIMLCAKYSGNYYHTIYENLIKLLYYDYPELAGVPIIIDESVQLIAAFRCIVDRLLANGSHPLLFLKKEEIASVDLLYSLTYVNHIVPNLRKGIVSVADDIVFDENSLRMFRNKMILPFARKDLPKRVFISRANVKVRQYNEEEIYEYLKPLGFVKVLPETLTFDEQVALFNNAEIIVGGAGAAFTNVLFCNPNAVAICFVRNSDKSFVGAFSIPAYVSGCKLVYFISKHSKHFRGDAGHSNYRIEVADLSAFFSTQLLLNAV